MLLLPNRKLIRPTRRSLLVGAGVILAAPAIVRAQNSLTLTGVGGNAANMTWQTSFSGTLNSDLANRSPTNIHQTFVLTVNGGTKMRFTFTGPTAGEGTHFDSVYACVVEPIAPMTVGPSVQVTVGTSANWTVAAGASVVSDDILIARNGWNLYAGMYFNDTSNDQIARNIFGLGLSAAFFELQGAGDDSANPSNTSGYTTIVASLCCITKVEEYAP